MSLNDQITALTTAMSSANTAVVNATNRKTATAGTADNANALNGQTATQMVTTANTHTDAHATRTDNPHATTAAQIGAYDKPTIDAKVAALLPSGVVPVSRFGSAAGGALPITVDGTAGTVAVTSAIPVLMAGQSFNLAPVTVNLIAGGTTYLYARLVGGVLSLVAAAVVSPESATNMYLGMVTLSGTTVSANTIGPVTRLDNYRVSGAAIGSAISVSNGTPDQTGQHLAWT